MPDVLPLSQRPFDVAVVAFLISHIPITILIDSQPCRLGILSNCKQC